MATSTRVLMVFPNRDDSLGSRVLKSDFCCFYFYFVSCMLRTRYCVIYDDVPVHRKEQRPYSPAAIHEACRL